MASLLPSEGRRAGYESFKALLELVLPVADAQYLLVDRAPMLRYIVCDEGGSQARFLLSRLNPSTTHMSATMYGSTAGTALAGQAISTDSVSLQVFMKQLVALLLLAKMIICIRIDKSSLLVVVIALI